MKRAVKMHTQLAHGKNKHESGEGSPYAWGHVPPKSSLSLANLYIKVYTKIMGSATPTMSRGCPPTTACKTPAVAVAARTWILLSKPFVSIAICSPNARAGRAEAKKM